LKTTFKPPKKVSRQDAALSNRVKEFLAKKDEEERMEQERKDEEKRVCWFLINNHWVIVNSTFCLESARKEIWRL
jgi:hypothetical protein